MGPKQVLVTSFRAQGSMPDSGSVTLLIFNGQYLIVIKPNAADIVYIAQFYVQTHHNLPLETGIAGVQ